MNVRKIESKIAANLITEPATSPEGKKEYQRVEQNLSRARRHDPAGYQSRLGNLIRAFQAFDEFQTRYARQEIEAFERAAKRKL